MDEFIAYSDKIRFITRSPFRTIEGYERPTDWRERFAHHARGLRASNMFLTRQKVEDGIRCGAISAMVKALQDTTSLTHPEIIQEILNDPEKAHYLDAKIASVPHTDSGRPRRYAQESA